MPQFAANLTMLFNEAPFMERFEKAAKSGFHAVEFLFPYAFAAEEIKQKLKKIPNLSAQDLVMAEFAFGNLLKIREMENLITIEGFITKDEEGNFKTHPMTQTLLKMQESVKNFLVKNDIILNCL